MWWWNKMHKILTKSRQHNCHIDSHWAKIKYFFLFLWQESDTKVNDVAYTLHQQKWRLKMPWHGSIKNALKFLQWEFCWCAVAANHPSTLRFEGAFAFDVFIRDTKYPVILSIYLSSSSQGLHQKFTTAVFIHLLPGSSAV